MHELAAFFRAALAVFRISFRPMLFSRRTVFTTTLTIIPVLAGALWWFGRLFLDFEATPRGYTIFSFVMVHVTIQFLILLVSLFYGCSLIAEEVDGKTITYLTTRPVPKAAIPIGKYLAFVLSALMVLLPSVLISYVALTLGDGTRSFRRHLDALGFDLLLVFLGILAYGAIFTLLGIVFKKPLLVGFLYAIFWETLVSMVPSATKLTIMHYIQSLSPHISERMALVQLTGQTASTATSAYVLFLVTATTLILLGIVFRRREFVLDQ